MDLLLGEIVQMTMDLGMKSVSKFTRIVSILANPVGDLETLKSMPALAKCLDHDALGDHDLFTLTRYVNFHVNGSSLEFG